MAEDEAKCSISAGGRAEKTCLSDREKIDWIRLIRTETIGPITFHELISVFGSAGAALDAIPELSQRGGTRGVFPIYPLELAEREWEAAYNAGARVLSFAETDYPPLLKHIPAPPPLLYVRGAPELAAGKAVAVVGSRNASAAGRQIASDIARDLGSGGAIVVSGLARGIDTAAHEAALPIGTIGVIAGGIDRIYPPENAWLHDAIAERGLLVTECPPGFAPRGQDFPRRNRIVSGISSGVVVIEAAQKSGSLITARLALEQDRDVFAVPGHPLDPRASGTNGLIKGGACLVTCAEDILVELFGSYVKSCYAATTDQKVAWSAPSEPNIPRGLANGERDRILASLSVTPVHPDILLSQTGVSARELSVALLELDLAGRIERHRDQRISLKPGSTDPI